MESPQENGKVTKELASIYYDLADVAGFTTSPRELLKRAKEKGLKVSLKNINSWLEQQLSHSLHKKPNRKFPRRKVLSLRPNYTWVADLVDVYG